MLLALALTGGPAGAEEWVVKTLPRMDGGGTRCVMESARQSLQDGYQDTTAYVRVDARSVTYERLAAHIDDPRSRQRFTAAIEELSEP